MSYCYQYIEVVQDVVHLSDDLCIWPKSALELFVYPIAYKAITFKYFVVSNLYTDASMFILKVELIL